MNKKVKWMLISASLLVFLASCFQPCYLAGQHDTSGAYGLLILLFGIFNASKSFVVWFANPMYVIAIVETIRNGKSSLISSGVAFLIALSFLVLDEIVINEAGHVSQVREYLSGYWCWVTAIGLVFGYDAIEKIIVYRHNIGR